MFYFSLFSLSEQSKSMLTELCLASDEFDHFAVQAHSSVTFCLKELRVRQRTKERMIDEKNKRMILEGGVWGKKSCGEIVVAAKLCYCLLSSRVC